jgi:hypothetical protein
LIFFELYSFFGKQKKKKSKYFYRLEEVPSNDRMILFGEKIKGVLVSGK